MAEARETITNKGKPALEVDGYLYRQDRVSKRAKTWRCCVSKCPARCKTDLNNRNIQFSNEHVGHEAKTATEIVVDEFRKKCRKRGGEELFDRPSKLMRVELAVGDAERHINVKDLHCARKAIYYQRRKILPRLPKDRTETHQSVNEFGLTSSTGEDMILKNDVETGIIMFSTASNLQLLCAEGIHVLGDGTFKTCPRFFYQLYILHAYDRGLYVPCVFCLLPSKTENVYRDMFTSIRNMCAEQNHVLQIQSIHLDFEKAAHVAVQAVWPHVHIKCCHFHLSQSWYRKIASVGLGDEYKTADSEIGLWLKRFFGLSFLTPAEIQDAVAFDLMDDAPDDPRCTSFSDYVLQNYVGAEASFAPAVWADPEIDSIRTTNACESFHRHFADNFYYAHPSIFEFMSVLQAVQTSSYVKMNSIQTGLGLPAVRPQRRQKLQEMRRLRARYDAGELNRKEYVRAMAFKNLPVVV